MRKQPRKNKSNDTRHQIQNTKPSDEETGLVPLQIIRTETVISRLPIHNLVKGGEVNIQIIQKTDNGKVSLHWEVSPSKRFGHPGQLAYKLDTIIINRIIDEVGRPVPRLIKVGTLNQLCNELGSQKGELKKSLQQNAATTISAKLHYKSKDGTERKLEATFARYSVVFTGETLPNGEKADEIYVIFNDPYLEVLNSAPIRPLNYDYLKQLSPTSQRFYEIISYRIYAAIKYGHLQAKLLYSEYCTYSAQRRHDSFERARLQMYRLHKPHLESSYITKVDYEEYIDGEGKIDWVIHYTPGPKARIEFETFNRKQGAGALTDVDASDSSPELIAKHKKQIEKRDNKDDPDLPARDLIRYFHKVVHGKKDYQPNSASKEFNQAKALLAEHGVEKARNIVDFALQEARKTKFNMRSFGAILQYADDASQAYEKWLEDQSRQAEVARAGEEQSQLEMDRYQQAEERLKGLSQGDYSSLYERVKEELLRNHSNTVSKFDGKALDSTVKAGMLKLLVEEMYNII